jgi:hypothetical protein
MKRLALLWFASLVIVAILASSLTRAQTTQVGSILSGSDIGFRVEGRDRSGNPTGTLVVRLNGQWVETRSTLRTLPTTK